MTNKRFEFATAGRIIFGPGTLRETGALAKEFGRRALVVMGRDKRSGVRPARNHTHLYPAASRAVSIRSAHPGDHANIPCRFREGEWIMESPPVLDGKFWSPMRMVQV